MNEKAEGQMLKAKIKSGGAWGLPRVIGSPEAPSPPPGSTPAKNIATTPGSITWGKTLKVSLAPEEFSIVNWAQRVCPASMAAHRAIGIAPFAQQALFEAVRQVIAAVARRGGEIPPGVAKEYEHWKDRLKAEKIGNSEP